MVVVALVTMAMVVVLSAFNGIDSLIDERYSYFDTDISILPLTSKVIKADEMNCDEIKAIDGVASCHRVIEERVFAEYDNNQRIVKVKGVEKGFFPQSRLDTMIIGGKGVMELENNPAAIVGVGVKYDLDLQLFEQVFNPLRLAAVVRGKNLRRDMEQALNKKNIPVAGIFSINIDFDSEYVIVPLDFAADLLGYSDEVSMLELQLTPEANLEEVKTEIENLVGADYQVRTRYEKNELIYKTNRTEKWATFMIMGFILLIATFNIIAALTLLINEKRDDIKTLASLGAPASLIKRVFFFEGALINFVGALVGLVLGFLFVILQQNFGLIRLEGGLVPYYPVEIALPDLLAVFGLVLTCGILSSILPVQFFTRKYTDL